MVRQWRRHANVMQERLAADTFPSIKWLQYGKMYSFEGSRSIEALTDFVQVMRAP